MSFDPTSEDNAELNDNEETAGTNNADESEAELAEKASQTARKLEPLVLAHVLGPKYQPVKPRVIAKQLKLPSEQHRGLKLAIRRLVKSGKLSYGAGHIVRPPKPAPATPSGNASEGTQARSASEGKGRRVKNDNVTGRLTPPARQEKDEETLTPALSQEEREQEEQDTDSTESLEETRTPSRHGKNTVTGVFRRTAAGFGFVRPEGAKRGDKAGDIYIAGSRDDGCCRPRHGPRAAEQEAGPRPGRGAAAGGRDRRDRRARHAPVRRRLSRARRDELRPGRWQGLCPAGAGRRSRGQGGRGRRQGRDRDGPLSHARCTRAKRSSSKCSAAAASRASIRSRSSANSACPKSFPTTCWTMPASRPKSSTNRSADRLDLTGETIITIDPVDARDFDDAISLTRARQRPLEAGRAYRRRVALRAGPLAARSRSAASGARASICPTA